MFVHMKARKKMLFLLLLNRKIHKRNKRKCRFNGPIMFGCIMSMRLKISKQEQTARIRNKNICSTLADAMRIWDQTSMMLLTSERGTKSLTTCRIDLKVMNDLLEINTTRKRRLAFVTKRNAASLQQTSFLLLKNSPVLCSQNSSHREVSDFAAYREQDAAFVPPASLSSKRVQSGRNRRRVVDDRRRLSDENKICAVAATWRRANQK